MSDDSITANIAQWTKQNAEFTDPAAQRHWASEHIFWGVFSIPVSAIIRRAVSSCAGVMSTPIGLAPSLASHAEKYAVPQPSSTTSRPSTSPSTLSSDSSIAQMPHEISSSAQLVVAFSFVYSAFACVQSSRLRFASSEIPGMA